MLGGDKEMSSLIRDNENVALKRNIRRLFRSYWAVFKQINMANFQNIGKEYAKSIGNVDLEDIVSFIGDIYEDWIAFLAVKNKSHYDGVYREFENHLFSPYSFFSENFRDSVLFISVLYNHKHVLEVIASTFAFEHPDIVESWKMNRRNGTPLQKYFYNKFVQ